MPDEKSEIDARVWYAGLPMVARRELTADERRELAEIRRDATRQVAWPIAMFVAMFVALLLSVWFEQLQWMLGPAALFLIISSYRRLPQSVSQVLRFLRALRADLRAGKVDVCQGKARDLVTNFGTLLRHERAIVRVDDPDATITIEVLPASLLLLRRDGRWPGEIALVRSARPSAVPEHARMAANFVKAVDDNDRLFMHQRILTDEERGELASYLPRVPVTSIVFAIIAVCMAILCLLAALAGSREVIVPFIVFAVVAGIRIPRIIATLKTRRKLQRDLEEGYVAIVRVRDETELGVAQEFLRHSFALWSVDGKPAEWRHIVTRRQPAS